MPNIKSAKKKLRKDIKRTKRNTHQRTALKKLFKSSKKKTEKPNTNLLKEAYSIIDKAKKRKIIHKNKAARLKSRVSKLLRKK